MRFVVGALELIAAVLLVIPRRQSRFLGVAMLVLVLSGAVTRPVAPSRSATITTPGPGDTPE